MQVDFPLLVLAGTAHHACLDDAGLVHEIFIQRQRRSSKEEFASILDPEGDADFVTADLLSACRFAAASKCKSSTLDLDAPLPAADQSMYEPTRRERCFVPPKRYFRSFWRSTAMRLVEMDIAASQHCSPTIDHA